MADWLSLLFDLLKLTIPALIVFITVYNLLKQYLDGQYRLKLLDFQRNHQNTSTPLRLQAYERLTLLCERIDIPNLLLNYGDQSISSAQLRLNLMLAVQQEFEFNLTQQLYVSQKLWDIIKLAKDDVLNSLNVVYEQVSPSARGQEYANALVNFYNERKTSGPETAINAIKKEASLVF